MKNAGISRKKIVPIKRNTILSIMLFAILAVWTVWGNKALMVSTISISSSHIPAAFSVLFLFLLHFHQKQNIFYTLKDMFLLETLFESFLDNPPVSLPFSTIYIQKPIIALRNNNRLFFYPICIRAMFSFIQINILYIVKRLNLFNCQ